MAELNAWCARQGMNFPRLAAYILARSLSEGVDFSAYWRTLNGLCAATPPPLEQHPRAFREGYGLVKGAFLRAGHMGGAGVGAFFDLAFTPATYARLMGTLRLNSFSVPCPMLPEGAAAAPAAAASPSAAAAAEPLAAAQGGCCAGTEAPACDTDGGSSSCGESAAAMGDAPGGTAIYALASLANHNCEPSADVVLAPGGALALRARRDMAAGEAVTITYLDSSLPFAFRSRRLELGYGFVCKCERCTLRL